jgi:hypothetical protein
MKSRFLALYACLMTCAFHANADTLTLKDGSTLEGTILREDDVSYVLEVRISKSIKDERSVAKADVAKIQRVLPDQTAFEPISKLIPVPDALTAEAYARRIQAVEKFLKEHRGSSKSKEARAILAALKAEANEILAGGIKLNGKILPPAEYRANAFEIDARIREAEIRALIKDARYLAALRAFSEFDREFLSTEPRAALLPLMNQVMTGYLAQIEQLLATYDARVKDRADGLKRMSLADRRSTESAIAEESAESEELFKVEKDAKLGWVTAHPFFKPSLEETMTFGKQEAARLSASGSTPAVDGGKAYREAMQKIQSGGEPAAITAAISAAKTAMVSPKYLAILEAAAANAAAPR